MDGENMTDGVIEQGREVESLGNTLDKVQLKFHQQWSMQLPVCAHIYTLDPCVQNINSVSFLCVYLCFLFPRQTERCMV